MPYAIYAMGPHARLGNTSPPAPRLGQRLGCQGQAKNPDWQVGKNLPPRQYAGAGGLRRSGKGRFEKRRVPEPSLLAHHAVLAGDAAVVDGHRAGDALHGDAVRRVAADGCVFSEARPVAAGCIGQAGLQGGGQAGELRAALPSLAGVARPAVPRREPARCGHQAATQPHRPSSKLKYCIALRRSRSTRRPISPNPAMAASAAPPLC